MDKLLAFPIKDGDFFFFERELGYESSANFPHNEHIKIIYDAGMDRNLFKKFRAYCKSKSVDIIVCTHTDLDHVAGIHKLVKRKTFGIGELWLPVEWSAIDFNLSVSQEDYYERLIKKIAEEAGVEDDVPVDYPSIVWRYNKLKYFKKIVSKHGKNVREKSLYHILISVTIRNVIKKAIARNIKIRWFEFDENKSSGGEPFLLPVNCREVAQINCVNDILHLTPKNMRALVFYSPKKEQYNLLFSSDSNFDFNQTLPSNFTDDRFLYTAPHHGSFDNSNAYKKIDRIASKKSISVKSFSPKVRIGNDYINSNAIKFCVACNDALPVKSYSLVSCEFQGKWKVTNGQACKCKAGACR